MTIVSVSLPDALVAEADRFIAERGLAGRSDLTRAALRDFLAREATAPATGAPLSATLTLLYPEGYERKVADIRHEFTDIVRSVMHGHAGEGCVELFMLEGPPRRIQQFADVLRSAKETRLVHVVYMDDSKKLSNRAPGHRH